MDKKTVYMMSKDVYQMNRNEFDAWWNTFDIEDDYESSVQYDIDFEYFMARRYGRWEVQHEDMLP